MKVGCWVEVVVYFQLPPLGGVLKVRQRVEVILLVKRSSGGELEIIETLDLSSFIG